MILKPSSCPTDYIFCFHAGSYIMAEKYKRIECEGNTVYLQLNDVSYYIFSTYSSVIMIYCTVHIFFKFC